MANVPDEGTGRERIIVIGEMPAQHEEAQGRPFVGPSGQLLAHWMRAAGLSRNAAYWTNVIPYRHNTKNDASRVPRHEVDEYARVLHAKLDTFTEATVIVPMGNVALRAILGMTGITKYRGSILEYDNGRRRTKVIPTLHPAATFKQPSWARRCQMDWHRIAADSAFRDLRLPSREHFIEPTLRDLTDYVEDARARAEVLMIDIETPRRLVLTERTLKSGKRSWKRSKGGARVTVVGFSFEPHFSFTVPTTPEYWAQQGVDVADVWRLLRELCALPGVEKGGQNFGFDAWWLLRDHACPVTDYLWDTRWLDHCADVLDEHSLAYQASIHLRTQYWKDDSKEEGDAHVDPSPDGLKTYWTYNGKDAAHTRELVEVHHARLGSTGRLAHYLRRYVPLFQPMLSLSQGGIRINTRSILLAQQRIAGELATIKDDLVAAVGAPLWGAKGSFSTKKVTTYLYDTLRLPAQRDRKTGNRSANEIVVRRLMLKHPAKLATVGPLFLRHRRLEALSRFVREGIVDPDGYSRCSYGFTYTMRFTHGKNPNRTGNNHANTDRELLAMYVPDPGHLFVEVDESQGEDRIVKVLAAALPSTALERREALLRRARAMPWDNDEHRLAASMIFGVPLDAVTKDQRYIGKRARHAGNYGMHGKTLSDQLLKEGVSHTPEECDAFITAVVDRDTPEVREWQKATRATVLRDRRLVNSWGHLVDFTHERLGDDLFREAYAFIPQSELTSIVKYWGLVPLDRAIPARGWDARIVLEKHDSLLVSTAPGCAWDVVTFLKASLERPRVYAGHELTIPCEVKLGRSGALSHEFKRMPTRAEFDAVVARLV